ncbi:MAG TPA: c-type cytochrome [Thermoanaerobaculia bacterium]
MPRFRATAIVLLALFLLPAFAVAPQAAQAPQAEPEPPPFQNLQVLPEDIPRQELIDTMKGFTRALGVRCNHCHVGEGDDLSLYDFPSDAKHEKRSARVMIEMVQAINRDFLPRVEHEEHSHGEEHAAHAEDHGHAEGHEADHPQGHEAAHAEGHEAEAGEAHEVARVTCMTCHRGQPEPRIEAAPAAGDTAPDAGSTPPGAPPAPEPPEPPPPPPGG